jgi:hypothetical protein
MMNFEIGKTLVGGFPFRNMPQAAPFDQAIEIFGEIRGVVSGALQGLRHEQHIEAGRIALRYGFRQMFLEQSVADAVDVLIHL